MILVALNNLRLTNKQEAFAIAFVECGVASEAYRGAYNNNCTDKQMWEEASKLLAKPKVAQRVAQLQSNAAEKHEITLERLTKEFLSTYTEARESRQYGAATSALNSLAKMHGHMVERGVIKHQHEVSILAPDEINSAIGEIRELIAEKKVEQGSANAKTIDVEPKLLEVTE